MSREAFALPPFVVVIADDDTDNAGKIDKSALYTVSQPTVSPLDFLVPKFNFSLIHSASFFPSWRDVLGVAAGSCAGSFSRNALCHCLQSTSAAATLPTSPLLATAIGCFLFSFAAASPMRRDLPHAFAALTFGYCSALAPFTPVVMNFLASVKTIGAIGQSITQLTMTIVVAILTSAVGHRAGVLVSRTDDDDDDNDGITRRQHGDRLAITAVVGLVFVHAAFLLWYGASLLSMSTWAPAPIGAVPRYFMCCLLASTFPRATPVGVNPLGTFLCNMLSVAVAAVNGVNRRPPHIVVAEGLSSGEASWSSSFATVLVCVCCAMSSLPAVVRSITPSAAHPNVLNDDSNYGYRSLTSALVHLLASFFCAGLLLCVV